jgi:hypothetical protein
LAEIYFSSVFTGYITRKLAGGLPSLFLASPFPCYCWRRRWAKPRGAAAGISLVTALEQNDGSRSSSPDAVVRAKKSILTIGSIFGY